MQWGSAALRRSFEVLAAGAFVWGAAGCSGGGDLLGQGDSPPGRVVLGGTQRINGADVVTFATLDDDNVVREVGATIPLSVIENPPEHGTGPAGAFVVLPFPDEVRSTTFFDHFELHWNPHGHDPHPIYHVPHFDVHFYGVPVSEVLSVVAPDTTIPDPRRIAPGYVYPGPEDTVPEMGIHSLPAEDLLPGAQFTASMILGYYRGELTMLEPMITREWFLRKENRTLAVARPEIVGRATRYPTRVDITYNAGKDAFDIVFRDFVTVTQ